MRLYQCFMAARCRCNSLTGLFFDFVKHMSLKNVAGGYFRMVKTSCVAHADPLHHLFGRCIYCRCEGKDFVKLQVGEAVLQTCPGCFGCISLSPEYFIVPPANFYAGG